LLSPNWNTISLLYSQKPSDPFTEGQESSTMSPIGRFLLRLCGNDFRINLKDPVVLQHMKDNNFRVERVRLAAIFLGVTLDGGS
jgi:hypothetical protein